MEPRLRALALFLKGMSVDPAIDSLDSRLTVQKAVYLGQRAGADLGYRYGWYVKGPYSPSLTRDYFALDEARTRGLDDSDGFTLHPLLANQLAGLHGLLDVPEDVQLSQPKWLELLASLDYLRTIRRLSPPLAKGVLQSEKRSLSRYEAVAQRALEHYGLLAAPNAPAN